MVPGTEECHLHLMRNICPNLRLRTPRQPCLRRGGVDFLRIVPVGTARHTDGPWHTFPMLSYETGRLTLRPWTPDDADFVFDLYSRWEVQRFIGKTPQIMADRSEALARLVKWMSLDHAVHGIWAVDQKESGRPAGVLLLKAIPFSQGVEDLPQDTEIGWHFHPDFWGRGYASEAATVILGHAFDRGLDEVVAVTNPSNTASRRVCGRIGMQHLGETSRYYDTVCELYVAARGHFLL